MLRGGRRVEKNLHKKVNYTAIAIKGLLFHYKPTADKTLSVMVLYGSGKLETLYVFPSIFKGAHIKHTEMVEVLSGHEITVEFDRPTPLQIDGEIVLWVPHTAFSSTPGKETYTKAETAARLLQPVAIQ